MPLFFFFFWTRFGTLMTGKNITNLLAEDLKGWPLTSQFWSIAPGFTPWSLPQGSKDEWGVTTRQSRRAGRRCDSGDDMVSVLLWMSEARLVWKAPVVNQCKSKGSCFVEEEFFFLPYYIDLPSFLLPVIPLFYEGVDKKKSDYRLWYQIVTTHFIYIALYIYLIVVYIV